MRAVLRVSTLAAVSTLLMAAKTPEAPVDPGPRPSSLEHFREAGQQAILQGFFDPSSAQFQWDRAITGGYWKPVFQKKVIGWWTCGLVNGKNRMGGYVGFRRFVVVMNNDQVVFSQVGEGGDFDFVELGCQKAIQAGYLPLASAVPASTPAIDPSQPQFGFGFNIVPDGAYIGVIVPAGPADKAGLTTGMVISAINSIPIKGFDQPTVAKILKNLDTTATFTIIGRGDVKLTRAPIQ
ncbi:PDZ domain-containing protein [Flavisphingomonas formosensis]|uniref:PDZ domain-containing protein n=1 Tax=Flavisphingomonas formosensis TaxID=861534 RepID=UPI0012F8272E|nr:PDZ domain-containing protein [Sphingomonas formosensis]